MKEIKETNHHIAEMNMFQTSRLATLFLNSFLEDLNEESVIKMHIHHILKD